MERIIAACKSALANDGYVIALTGAGVSAESGIPTFRGKEGYWTVGAREYHPQELATHEAFTHMPWDVWAWYLYRRGVCRAAQPNTAHPVPAATIPMTFRAAGRLDISQIPVRFPNRAVAIAGKVLKNPSGS